MEKGSVMKTLQTFSYQPQLIHNEYFFLVMLQDVRLNGNRSSPQHIQFIQCTLCFGNLNKIDLSHIRFSECIFIDNISFGSTNLRTTRFTNSKFESSIIIDDHFEYDPESGLFQADFTCLEFIFSRENTDIPAGTTLRAQKLIAGYAQYATDPVKISQFMIRTDEQHQTYTALKILADALADVDEAAVKALKYAYYCEFICCPASIKSNLIADLVKLGLRNFSNSRIYAPNGESIIHWASLDLKGGNFSNVRFMHPVDLTLANLADSNFNQAVFVGGIILDHARCGGMIDSKFKEAVSTGFYITDPNRTIEHKIPIPSLIFYTFFREHYDSLLKRSFKSIDVIENDQSILVTDAATANQTLLDFLTRLDVWLHPTGKEIGKYLGNQLIRYQRMLVSTFSDDEASDFSKSTISLRQLGILHQHFFDITKLHQVLSSTIEDQRLALVQQLHNSSSMSHKVHLLSLRLQSLQLIISTVYHEKNISMMLKVALYYVKFMNPSTKILSRLNSKITAPESFLITVYEQTLAFDSSEVSDLLPSLSSRQRFFINSDDSLEDESENEIGLSTQPPSPETH